MTKVRATLESGDTETVACPGVPVEDITPSYIEERTDFDSPVVSVSVTRGIADRVSRLEDGAGVGGTAKSGIAQRIDDLESRVEDLESQ